MLCWLAFQLLLLLLWTWRSPTHHKNSDILSSLKLNISHSEFMQSISFCSFWLEPFRSIHENVIFAIILERKQFVILCVWCNTWCRTNVAGINITFCSVLSICSRIYPIVLLLPAQTRNLTWKFHSRHKTHMRQFQS